MPSLQTTPQNRRGSAGSAGADVDRSLEDNSGKGDAGKRSQSPGCCGKRAPSPGKTERTGVSPRRFNQTSESPRAFVRRPDSPRSAMRRANSPRGAAGRGESLGRCDRSRHSSTDRDENGGSRLTISEFLSGKGDKRQSQKRSSSLGRRDGNPCDRPASGKSAGGHDQDFFDERSYRRGRPFFSNRTQQENRFNSGCSSYRDNVDYYIHRPVSQGRCDGSGLNKIRSHHVMMGEPRQRMDYYDADHIYPRHGRDYSFDRKNCDEMVSDRYERSSHRGNVARKEREYRSSDETDIFRFNRYGFDKYGFDPYGFDKNGRDRFGNYRMSTNDQCSRY